MEKQPSIGTYTAYQISLYETLASKHEHITPGHFFAGITKLEDALHPDILKYLDIPQQIIPALQSEITSILKLFSDFNIPPRDVRHKIREILGKGNYERTEKEVVHRSAEVKKAFSRAEAIAHEKNAEYIFLHNLLATLLEIPNTKIGDLLTELHVFPVFFTGYMASLLPFCNIKPNFFVLSNESESLFFIASFKDISFTSS